MATKTWLPLSIFLAESTDPSTVGVSVVDSVVIECLGSETRHLSLNPGSPCTSKSRDPLALKSCVKLGKAFLRIVGSIK